MFNLYLVVNTFSEYKLEWLFLRLSFYFLSPSPF